MKLNFIKNFLHKFKTEKKGFSLSDTAAVISTLAIVSVSSVAIKSIDNKNRRMINDNQKIERIYSAMERFVKTNKRMPCPAGLLKIKGTSTDYAQEIGSEDTCVGNATHGVYAISADNNLLYGAVPVKTLGLSLENAEDGFGAKFVYIVDRRLVYNTTSSNAGGNFSTTTSSSIKIVENSIEISPDSVMIIMSYGKNKSGAFNANSSTYNALPLSSSISETDNAFTSISNTTINMTDTTFVKSVKSDAIFDDLIFFKNKKTLISDFKADSLISCTNAGDKYGNKNAQFNEIVFATANCPEPNQAVRAAKKCSKDGKWIFEKSCPCYVDVNGIDPNSVPNGSGNIKCTKTSYSGVLKYTCDDDGNLTINEYCKKSCNFSAIGISHVIPDGISIVSCNQPNFKGDYVVTCNDGTITSQVGACKSSTCLVGGYSGMLSQTVNSGSSSTQGLCDSGGGYSGFYSYSCEDGIGVVTDKCYKDCSFSTVGVSSTTIKHGKNIIACPANSVSKNISVDCNDGIATIESGSCQVQGKCTVGSGVGMIAKSVFNGTSGSDGTCATGYSGSYSYTCSESGVQSTTNNCIPNNCIVGNDISGLISKTVSINTSGNDGKCAAGYGGFYSWSCSNKGVPSVTANNCINFCKVGTSDMGEGMIEEIVAFGKSGETGLCDVGKGYTGNYSWSCVENPDTKIVESKVLVNNCKNFCTVGTADDGEGMVQKLVKINSTGVNGTCAAGYVGSYRWSCDGNGTPKVLENKCINSCQVGILAQGKGMIAKKVNLNTSGSDGVCDTAAGYSGSYSWSCSASGVAQVTTNSCTCGADGLCQNSCRVGTLAQGIGMIEKRVAFNTSGSDGLCNTADGYVGSFNWSCSASGVSRITANNCTRTTCLVDVSSYTGLQSFLGFANSKGTNGLCADGYVGSYSWQCNSLGAGSVVSNNCQPIKCRIPEGVIGFNANSIDIAYGQNTYNCNSGDYAGTAIFKCSKNGILTTGIFSEISNSCVTACSVGVLANSTVNDGQTMSITISATDSIVSSKDSIIKNIVFASYGLPNTSGSTWLLGGCHASNSLSKVSAACLNKNTCSITANSSTFETLNCEDTSTKKLAVKYVYSLPQFKNTPKVPIGSGTINCSNGYLGTVNYTCGGSHDSFSYTGTCNPACEIASGFGYDGRVVTGSSSFLCDTSKGYLGSISYNCTAPNTNTLTGECKLIKCDVPSNNTMLAGQKVDFSSTFTPLLCSAGYYGSPTYKCTGPTEIGIYTAGGTNCQAITCDVDDIYKLNLSSVAYTPTASNINCAVGYTSGAIQPKFTCVNNGNNSKGTFTLTAGSCTAITCAVDSTHNFALTSVGYTGATNTNIACKSGFAYGTTQPTYTCTGTTNPGTYSKTAGTCAKIACTVPAGIVGFDSGTIGIEYGEFNYQCNSTNYSNSSTARFNCAANGNSTTGTFTQVSNNCACNTGYVKDASNNCVAQCSITATTTYAAATVTKTGTLDCLAGYTGSVSYNCSAPNTPNLVNNCTAITCAVDSTHNFALTSVGFTGATNTNIACKSGFAYGTTQPTYTCTGTTNPGTYSKTAGTCAKIACTVPAGIVGFDFGTIGIEYGEFNYQCNSTNYSNSSTARFNCAANGNSTTGTFTEVSNSCACKTGYVKDASNNCVAQCSITATTTYAAATVTKTGTLDCLAGYTGSVSYNCSAPNTPNLVNNCTAITCAVDSTHNFALTSVGYTGATNTNIACKSGFAYGTTQPTYTCTGTTNPGTYSKTAGTCSAITCAVTTGTVGFDPAKTVVNFGTANYNCNATNYSTTSTASFNCAANGNSTTGTFTEVSNSCACNTGYVKDASNNCVAQCSITATTTYAAATVTKTGTLDCLAGYTGSVSYNCSAPNTPNLVNNCTAITCAVDSTHNFALTSVGFTGATNTNIACKSGFAYGTTQPTYTCTGTTNPGTYSKTAGTCSAITCAVTTGTVGFDPAKTVVNFGTANYNCNATNYSTTSTASFNCAANGNSTTGTFTQVSNSCACNTGYVKDASNNCVAQCSITATTTYAAATVTKTGTLDCLAGYAGSVSYNCSAPNTPNLVNNCTAITCAVDSTHNFALTSVGYTGATNTNIACKSGFAYGTTQPTYTCTGTTNPGTYSKTAGTCAKIACTVPAGIVGFDFGTIGIEYGEFNYQCNSTNYSNSSTARFNCAANGNSTTGTFTEVSNSCACKTGYVKDASNNCVAQCSITATTTYAAATVTKTGTLDCLAGYTGSVSYNCSAPNTPNLVNNCTAITCAVDSTHNFALTSVGYTGATNTNIACKSGFAYGTTQPTYTCTGTTNPGTYSKTAGTCSAITCAVTTGTVGFDPAKTVVNFGTANYNCNATNYSTTSTASFNCAANGNSTTGTFTQVSNNCACNTGYVKDASNNCVAQCSITATTTYAAATVTKTGTLDCLAGYTGSVSYNCSAPNTPNLVNNCTAITCAVDSTHNFALTSVGFTGATNTNIACKSGFAYGTTQPTYTCTGTTNPGTYTKTAGTCSEIACTVPAGTAGFVTGTIGIKFGTATYSCNATNYSTTSTASFTCAANGNSTTGTFTQVTNSCACNTGYEKNANGDCVEKSCTIPTSFTNLSSYGIVAPTSTVKYVACATGYYDAIVNVWSGVINRNGGETQCQHTARIYNAMGGGLNYNCDSCNCGGPSAVMNWFGYANPFTQGLGNGWCESPCAWHNATTKAAGLCLCDGGLAAAHFPGDIGTGLAYRCVQGNLYASSNCQPITCNASAVTGFTSKSVNHSSVTPTLSCDVAGYSGTLTNTCSTNGSTITPTGSCTQTTCTASAVTGFTSKSVSHSSVTPTLSCDVAGYTGTLTNTCSTNGSTITPTGSCTAITCAITAGTGYSGRTLNFGSGSFACNASGYSGTINYNCNALNTPNLSGTCSTSQCIIPAGSGYNQASVNVGSGTLSCNSGYSGSINYTCGCNNIYTNAGPGDSIVYNYYNQSFASFTAPVAGRIKSVTLKVTGATNNGGFIKFNTWGSPSQTYPGEVWSFTDLRDHVINLDPYNVSLSQGQVQTFQWTTLETWRYFTGLFKSDGSLVYYVDFLPASGSSCSNLTSTITGGSCAPVCSISGTGYNARNVTGSGSFACDVGGYTGTISYNCTAPNVPNLSGSCAPVCSISGTGYNARNVTGSGSFACDVPGYSGTISYNCTAPGVPNIGGSCASSGGFTPNWYAWTSVGCGSYAYDLSNNSVGVVGPEGCGGQWSYYFTYLPGWATRVSFDFQYCIYDWNAYYDPGRLYVNNTWYDVFTSGGGYGSCHYGTWSNFPVQGGTAFGPGIYSIDGCCGRGVLKFYNIVVQ